MALLRRFGQLATLSKTSVGHAIDLFTKSSTEERLKLKSDFSTYALELLSRKHTAQALYDLTQFSIQQDIPISLKHLDDQEQLDKFMVQAIRAGDMRDVNSALYLYHCHPFLPVPAYSVYCQLVSDAPRGSPENQELWRKTLADMLYYGYPTSASETMNALFFANYGPYSRTLLAFLRFSVEDESIAYARSKVKDDRNVQEEKKLTVEEEAEKCLEETQVALDNFTGTYINHINYSNYTKEDYELGRDYMHFEANRNLRLFQRDSVDVMVSIASVHKDYEFISEVFLNYNTFTGGPRSNIVVSKVLEFLALGQFKGSKWEAIKQVIAEQISVELDPELVETTYGEPMLCQLPSTNSAVISGLISAELYARAAHYIFDCSRCDLPYDPQYEIALARYFLKEKNYPMLLMVCESSEDSLNHSELQESLAQLKTELEKKGEVCEERLFLSKHYKATDPLLEPYLLSIRAPTVASSDKDFIYAAARFEVIQDCFQQDVDMERVSTGEEPQQIGEPSTEVKSAAPEEQEAGDEKSLEPSSS